MPTKAVRLTMPLVGEANAAGYLVMVPGASVLIRQNGVALVGSAGPGTAAVFSDNDKTPMTNPVPTGVTPGTAGVDTDGRLLVYLNPGSGYDVQATVGNATTTAPLPDVSVDAADVTEVADFTALEAAVATKADTANNLSDLADVAAARVNIGAPATADVVTKAANLSDLADTVTSRANLGISSLMVTDLVQQVDRQKHSLFSLTRHPGNPIFTPAQAGVDFATILWPHILRVDTILDDPLGRYYMWFSTDHGASQGRIGMAHSDSPLGPWTSLGTVYLDRVIGDETETPSVLWNETTGLFHMYYQQNATNPTSVVFQSTCLATSPDGVNWTRVGIVIDWPDSTFARGFGHTGYFRAFRLGNMWYGYGLMSGGDDSLYALSYSADGIAWQVDPRPVMYFQDILSSHDHQLTGNGFHVVLYEGRPWLFARWRTFTSGLGVGESRMYAAPLSPDLRQVIGVPQTVLSGTGGEAWLVGDDLMRQNYVFIDEGRLYLYYGTADTFGVAYEEAS